MELYANEVYLKGNVGGDPQFHSFEGGNSVASFTLATSTGGYKRKDANGQEVDVPEVTQWHSVQVWGKDAVKVRDHVKKGMRVSVKGSIRYREYEAKEGGGKRMATDIISQSIEILSKVFFEKGVQAPAPTANDAPNGFAQAPAPTMDATDNFPPEQTDGNDLPF